MSPIVCFWDKIFPNRSPKTFQERVLLDGFYYLENVTKWSSMKIDFKHGPRQMRSARHQEQRC